MPPEAMPPDAGRLSWPHCPGLSNCGNDHLRCFLNQLRDIERPTKIIKDLPLSSFIHVAIGCHSAILCASGKLYSTGTCTLCLASMRFPAVMLGPSVFPVTFGPLLSGHPPSLHIDICDNFDAENNAHGGDARVEHI